MKKTAILTILIFVLLTATASAKTFTFETGDYEIVEADGFEILKSENTELYLEADELVLVKAVFPLTFPDTQVVEGIRLVEFKDPVDLELNIPTASETAFLEYEYIDRECFSDTRETDFFVNDPAILENEATYSIEIYPLEVVDCIDGKFRLYQTVVYEAVIIGSDSRIEIVEVPEKAAPGTTVPVKVTMNQDVEGMLQIKDIADSVIQTKSINGDREIINLKLPEEYDKQQYILEFQESGSVVAYKDFVIETTWGDIDLLVFKGDNPLEIPVMINITSFLDNEIESEGKIELIDWDGEVTQEIDFDHSLASGANVFNMDIEVTEAQQKDDIRITLEYEGSEISLTRNTVMRIDLERAAQAQKEYEQKKQEEIQPTTKSNIIGIIAAMLLFIVVGYFGLKYAKKRE